MTLGDPALDIVLIVAIALIITYGVFRGGRRARSAYGLGPEEPTPVERPAMNPANAPLASALYAASAGIESSSIRVSGCLRDLARAVRLEAKPVDPAIKDRTATFIEEFALDVSREAHVIREA